MFFHFISKRFTYSTGSAPTKKGKIQVYKGYFSMHLLLLLLGVTLPLRATALEDPTVKTLVEVPPITQEEAKEGESVPAPETPLTRLEFAQQMIERFELPKRWVLDGISPFSDIPLQSQHYPELETAWKYKLLLPSAETYAIKPLDPISRLDVWLAIKHLLFTHEKLRDPYNKALLLEDASVKSLEPISQDAVIVLYEHYVMDIILDFPLGAKEPVTQAWFDRVMQNVENARDLLKADAKRGISDTTLRQIPSLQAGLPLRISPQEAIIGANVRQGMAIYFELRQPLFPQQSDMLVESSVLTGYIQEMKPVSTAQPNVVEVTIVFDTIRNGHSNDVWKTNTSISFPISTERTQRVSTIGNDHNWVNNYVLPSEEFVTTTKALKEQP
jgi:hypothetical protein